MSKPAPQGTSPVPAPACASPPTSVQDREDLRQAMHESVNLTLLPPPPASAVEWRERAMRLCHGMPGLRDELVNVPIGWFSLVERAVEEIRRCLPPGSVLHTSQMKEKFGTLRWYHHVAMTKDDDFLETGAEGCVEWAEDVSADVCAIFGTPDAQVDSSGFWLLTLSARAASMRRESQASGSGATFTALMYPRWDD